MTTDFEKKHALKEKEAIKKQRDGKHFAIFLDYDGTLTPIVARPELAVLSDEMRDCLHRLGKNVTTAIVSGRMLSNLHDMVNVEGLFYAGNHGLELEGPEHLKLKYEKGHEYVDAVNEAAASITKSVGHIQGIIVEHKKFSLAVHYRLVDEKDVPIIEAAVDEAIKQQPTLRMLYNKKVFELRPAMDWDKGKAILFLLEALKLDENNTLPIYIGDDQTDEDAFRAIQGRGIGILVTNEPTETAASYYLHNTKEVEEFLEWIIGI